MITVSLEQAIADYKEADKNYQLAWGAYNSGAIGIDELKAVERAKSRAFKIYKDLKKKSFKF